MMTRYVLPFLGVCTLAFALTQMLKAQQKPAPVSPAIEPGKSPYVKQLAGSGVVEPETENIFIGSNVPGIVEKMFVKVGDIVKPNDPLFQIDDRTLRAEYKLRESLLVSAQASFNKLKLTPREDERPSNEAKVREAEVQVKDIQQQYDRVRRVGTSASEEETMRRQYALELAKAQLVHTQSDFKLWQAGAWQPDKDIAMAAVEQAKAQLGQTEIELQRLVTRAPRPHRTKAPQGDVPHDSNVQYKVLQVNIRPGEYVANGSTNGLIVLGFVGKLHVRVDIDENDISRFRPNLVGVAKPRGNPDVSFPLKFVNVDPFVIPKRSLTGANTERVDTRVLQVVYALETSEPLLYVGQQMDVFLNADETTSPPR